MPAILTDHDATTQSHKSRSIPDAEAPTNRGHARALEPRKDRQPIPRPRVTRAITARGTGTHAPRPAGGQTGIGPPATGKPRHDPNELGPQKNTPGPAIRVARENPRAKSASRGPRLKATHQSARKTSPRPRNLDHRRRQLPAEYNPRHPANPLLQIPRRGTGRRLLVKPEIRSRNQRKSSRAFSDVRTSTD